MELTYTGFQCSSRQSLLPGTCTCPLDCLSYTEWSPHLYSRHDKDGRKNKRKSKSSVLDRLKKRTGGESEKNTDEEQKKEAELHLYAVMLTSQIYINLQRSWNSYIMVRINGIDVQQAHVCSGLPVILCSYTSYIKIMYYKLYHIKLYVYIVPCILYQIVQISFLAFFFINLLPHYRFISPILGKSWPCFIHSFPCLTFNHGHFLMICSFIYLSLVLV